MQPKDGNNLRMFSRENRIRTEHARLEAMKKDRSGILRARQAVYWLRIIKGLLFKG